MLPNDEDQQAEPAALEVYTAGGGEYTVVVFEAAARHREAMARHQDGWPVRRQNHEIARQGRAIR